MITSSSPRRTANSGSAKNGVSDSGNTSAAPSVVLAVSHQIGGVADHVHLAVGLKPTHSVSKVLQELKKASSAWVHHELRLPGFAWQDGYTALTVSASVLPKLIDYVANQERHHRRKTFGKRWRIFSARLA